MKYLQILKICKITLRRSGHRFRKTYAESALICPGPLEQYNSSQFWKFLIWVWLTIFDSQNLKNQIFFSIFEVGCPLKSMWNTFSVCLYCSAERTTEVISLALHRVSHALNYNDWLWDSAPFWIRDLIKLSTHIRRTIGLSAVFRYINYNFTFPFVSTRISLFKISKVTINF